MTTIRRYLDSDAATVRHLHRFALEDAEAFEGAGRWDEDLERIREEYLDSGGEFLVGLIEEKVVAMGALRVTSDGAKIKRMFIPTISVVDWVVGYFLP